MISQRRIGGRSCPVATLGTKQGGRTANTAAAPGNDHKPLFG
jgi:hypothetical protein